MEKAIKKVPKGLLQQLEGQALQLTSDCAAIYALLDERAAPVKAKDIQATLGIGPESYRTACRALLNTTAELYVTQEGAVLKKYASEDHRYWHLAWSLGIFQVSGQHLTMDEDLLKRAPRAIKKLIDEGKLSDAARLQSLSKEAQQAKVVLLEVVEMYREIGKLLTAASRKQIKSKEWKSGLKKIKKELEK